MNAITFKKENENKWLFHIYYILVKCVNFIKTNSKQKQKNYINVLTYFFLFLSFYYFFLNTFCKNNIFFYLQINFEEF
jgi:hypothetical protein